MAKDGRGYSSEERYKLIGNLIEEIKLRRYSFQTGKSYTPIIKEFLLQQKRRESFCYHIQPRAKLV